MSESQEETQRQQHQHNQESQPVSLNSSTTADANHEDIIVYEFNFPRKFCGKLIGKNGVHVDHIRSKTRTQIAVRDDADNHEQQIVCVSGRLEDVDQALDIISSRFPLKQYPTISFKPISKPIVYRRINNEVESDRVLPYESTSVKKVIYENFRSLRFTLDKIFRELYSSEQYIPSDMKLKAFRRVDI